MQQNNLFQRLGGASMLDQILTKFTEKSMADPSMAPFFQGVDMQKLNEQRKAYFTMLFGGPSDYKGKSLEEAHKKLDLDEGQFNLFLSYFRTSMAELKIDQTVIDEAMLAIEKTMREVINKKTLFERLGGESFMQKLMDVFNTKMLADPVIGPIYSKYDLKKITELRMAYLTIMFGGKAQYNGKTMREAHAGHNLNDLHFGHFASVFKDSLVDMKVDSKMIEEVMEVLSTQRPEVLNKASLFERLGGFEMIDKALTISEERMKADPVLGPYFANVDLKKMHEGRKHHLAMLFGGPNAYSGRPLKEAHQKEKMDDNAFNIFLKQLYRSFLQAGAKEELVNEAIDVIDSTRDQVIGRKSILERIGGADTLQKIVERFHANVKMDKVLGSIYEKADTQRLTMGYTKYLTYLFGEISVFAEKPLKFAHGNLKLTDIHYDLFIQTFEKTMASFNVDKETMEEVSRLFEKKRSEVLQRESLWMRMGGIQVMDKAVSKFEEKIMADPALKQMHQQIDFKVYHEKHVDFFAMIFGGFNFYSGRSLRDAHAPLKMKDEHFNTFVELFQQSLRETGVSEDLVDEVKTAFEKTRNEVLNRRSLYERIGGEQAIELLVEKLNRQLAEDPVLGPMHKNVDWAKLQLHRSQFFTQLFGNLNVYQGKDIRSVHGPLQLNDEHFNLFMKMFRTAMTELKISEDMITEAMALIETTRREILNRPSLMEKIGGKAGLEKFVNKLDESVSKDPKMASFFEKTDMKKFDQEQLNFFSGLLGGQDIAPQGKGQKTFHEPLPLSDEHFKIFVGKAQETLSGMGVDKQVADEIVKALQAKRSEVLNQ